MFLFRYSLYLEEIIFKEISHRFVGWNSPPSIKIEVKDCQPGYKYQCTQFCFESDCHKNHQNGSNDILKNL